MALQGVDVCPPHSRSTESSTPEYAGRSLDTMQYYTPDAFTPYYFNNNNNRHTIDETCVDGVSLTHGQ